MSPVLRRAVSADQPAVEAIVAQAYGKYIPRIGRPPGPMLDDYAGLIARGVVHVLDGAGELLGLVVLEPEGDTMLLENVAVRPDAQGNGYGRVLLDFAAQSAREAGCGAIRLYTHELMTENQAIYRRYGFVETHRAETEGLKRVFMAKALD